jgi:PAS domain S-box-containing protein
MSESEFSALQGQSQNALRAGENEGLLSAIVNQSTVGVSVVDLEGRFKFVNDCFSRLVGRPREELLRLGFADVTHADDLSQNMEMFERARNGEGNFEVEKRYVRPDGTYVWVLNNVTFLRDAADVPSAVMSVTLDISDRKRAEARQARATKHTALRVEVSVAFNEGGSLRAILQSCAESVVRHLDAALARIWTLDTGGAVLELQASSGLYTHLDGGHARVPIGKYKIGLIAAERKPHLTNSVQKDERVGDKEWARREGLVSFAGYPLLVEGQLIGVVAMFARVALGQDTIEALESIASTIAQGVERKQAEGALRESEHNLRLLTEAIPQLIWSATPDGAIDYCNRQLLEYAGKTLEEMRGDGWVNFLHHEDVGYIMESWRMTVKTGEPFEVGCRLRRADGRFRWSISRGQPLRDAGGAIIRWYGTCTDMDKWKRAEGVLRETQGELAHLNRVMTVGELTSSIAHEINQPLAAIVMNGNACLRWLALDTPEVARARASAELIISDGNRASQVISRIRALLKKAPSAKSTLDVGELAREVIALTHHEVVSNGVNLRTNLGTALPPVSCDRIQLQQVMINLTVNAVDAMRGAEGGRRELLITAGKESGGVRVSMSDTGGGFDPRDAEHLFDAFYTTKSEGLGMGLAISRSIVEAHGGHLWAESNESGGATFHFTLPGGEGASP